jgi:hypothetical protein
VAVPAPLRDPPEMTVEPGQVAGLEPDHGPEVVDPAPPERGGVATSVASSARVASCRPTWHEPSSAQAR